MGAGPDHSVSNWSSSARENKEFLRSPFFEGDAHGIESKDNRAVMAVLFACDRFLRAPPKLFRGRAEFSFERSYTNRDWFRFRNEVQNFDPISEIVTKKVHTNRNSGSRFDGRKDAG